ncbi:pyrimidine utilization protein D [Sphingomonas canadensis]|uniref:Putative carbamate hydrolase RutD n=1 Tax=Sphingomonas canadensis TaxID=1219257 RepID=A0ABW3HCU4_9SPHN|nr:pyrimidine utilization protein D [Sphingomonas canadensis]MCW3836697.1 pyrimidine utilization protein D [Sphingomonas canadensis]
MPVAGGIWYEEHGPRDAPALILSPGLGGSGRYWEPNLPALAERFHVVLYDHRGTGRSDRALPDVVTVDQMGDDILTVIDALGVAVATVIGHAAGGVAGLSLALRAPERVARLVLVNAWSKPDPHFVRCFETRLELLRKSGPRAYLHAQPLFLYPAVFISRMHEFLAAEEADHLAHFAGAEAYEKRIAALMAFDADDQLGRVRVPTAVIAAEDDMLVPWTCSERIAEAIPAATMALMGWGGHACNFTDTATFNRLLLEILED